MLDTSLSLYANPFKKLDTNTFAGIKSCVEDILSGNEKASSCKDTLNFWMEVSSGDNDTDYKYILKQFVQILEEDFFEMDSFLYSLNLIFDYIGIHKNENPYTGDLLRCLSPCYFSLTKDLSTLVSGYSFDEKKLIQPRYKGKELIKELNKFMKSTSYSSDTDILFKNLHLQGFTNMLLSTVVFNEELSRLMYEFSSNYVLYEFPKPFGDLCINPSPARVKKRLSTFKDNNKILSEPIIISPKNVTGLLRHMIISPSINRMGEEVLAIRADFSSMSTLHAIVNIEKEYILSQYTLQELMDSNYEDSSYFYTVIVDVLYNLLIKGKRETNLWYIEGDLVLTDCGTLDDIESLGIKSCIEDAENNLMIITF